jgi:hypothetical protein
MRTDLMRVFACCLVGFGLGLVLISPVITTVEANALRSEAENLFERLPRVTRQDGIRYFGDSTWDYAQRRKTALLNEADEGLAAPDGAGRGRYHRLRHPPPRDPATAAPVRPPDF